MTFSTDFLNCYFVAGTQDCRHLKGDNAANLLRILDEALKAGITCYQFREKGEFALQDPQKIKALAIACRDLCRKYNVPFVMNNDVDLAIEIGADGVHVGQQDEPIKSVVQRFTQGFIGLSCNKIHLAQAVNDLAGLDYLGVGPMFDTQTKPEAGSGQSPQFIQQLRQAGVTKPLVAIGGISTENVAAVRSANPDGIAIVSAITQADDIAQVVAKLCQK